MTEYGWLIENGKQGYELRYRNMEQGQATWITDANEALRFARRIDAEKFAEEDEEAWIITEHAWDTEDKCKWKPTPEASYDFDYETECGELAVFVEGTVKDNKFEFCPFCGKKIEVDDAGCQMQRMRKARVQGDPGWDQVRDSRSDLA